MGGITDRPCPLCGPGGWPADEAGYFYCRIPYRRDHGLRDKRCQRQRSELWLWLGAATVAQWRHRRFYCILAGAAWRLHVRRAGEHAAGQRHRRVQFVRSGAENYQHYAILAKIRSLLEMVTIKLNGSACRRSLFCHAVVSIHLGAALVSPFWANEREWCWTRSSNHPNLVLIMRSRALLLLIFGLSILHATSWAKLPIGGTRFPRQCTRCAGRYAGAEQENASCGA